MARFNSDYNYLDNKLKIGGNFSASHMKKAQNPASDILFASLVMVIFLTSREIFLDVSLNFKKYNMKKNL